jgi:hypothetical protein
MFHLVMIAQPFAVIPHHDDTPVAPLVRLNGGGQLAHLAIHESDFSSILVPRIAGI